MPEATPDTDARQFDSADGIARCGARHRDGNACWAHLEHDGTCPNADQHATAWCGKCENGRAWTTVDGVRLLTACPDCAALNPTPAPSAAAGDARVRLDAFTTLPSLLHLFVIDLEDMRANGYGLGTAMVRRARSLAEHADRLLARATDVDALAAVLWEHDREEDRHYRRLLVLPTWEQAVREAEEWPDGAVAHVVRQYRARAQAITTWTQAVHRG